MNSQTGKPIGQVHLRQFHLPYDLHAVHLSHCTVVYSIMVNHRLSPDLKLATLHLWDLGWYEIDIIQGI